MKPVVTRKNVVGGEVIFRAIAGIVLIIAAFFFSGVAPWVVGLIGVALILTALFGY